jgi:hypothetical protein
MLLYDDLQFEFLSFSDIFYIDATNQQTLEMHLKAITPENVEQSVYASLYWLRNLCDQNWCLLFDNADDVHLPLQKFFPSCASGNILVTTRNAGLRLVVTQDSYEEVKRMDPEDAKNVLLLRSQVEKTEESHILAAEIVKVSHYAFGLENTCQLMHNAGTPLLCFGSLPSRCLHLLPLIFKQLPRALST